MDSYFPVRISGQVPYFLAIIDGEIALLGHFNPEEHDVKKWFNFGVQVSSSGVVRCLEGLFEFIVSPRSNSFDPGFITDTSDERHRRLEEDIFAEVAYLYVGDIY